MAGRKKQRGISFFTVIFIMAVCAAVGLVAVQAFPSVLEYQAALKAINKAKNEGTVAAVRAAFDRSADIDTITSISSKDLEITKDGDQVTVAFAYQKEFHMFGPAWLTLKYEGRSHPGR